MTDRNEAIAALEKQLEAIEAEMAKILEADEAVEAKTRKRVKVDPELLKAKSKKDDGDDEDYDDLKDQGDDDDDDDDDDDTEKRAKETDVNKADEAKVEKKDDEYLEVGEQRIAKSVVGDAAFAILKAQNERIAKGEEDIKKERDAREFETLKKRADDEYSHVPGSTDERAKMLKAMSAMDKDLVASFEKVFKQSEKLAKAAFAPMGTNGGKGTPNSDVAKSAAASFEAKVAEIKKRDECTRADALSKARTEFPEEYKAFQDSGH